MGSLTARFLVGAALLAFARPTAVLAEQSSTESAPPPHVVSLEGIVTIERERWQPVLEVVQSQLLTPVGLRSLAPGSADYKSK